MSLGPAAQNQARRALALMRPANVTPQEWHRHVTGLYIESQINPRLSSIPKEVLDAMKDILMLAKGPQQ